MPTGIYTASTSPALVLNPTSAAFGSNVVISQIYGGGGTTNPDFVELFNPTASSVTLTGYSIQYISAAGTAPNATFGINPLATLSIPAGGYYLVALGGTDTLTPAADQTFTAVATTSPVRQARCTLCPLRQR